MTELTERQREVLDFIVAYTRDHGYPPTIREMCEGLNVTSLSTVHFHLQALVRKGALVIEPDSPRAIRVVDA